MGFDGFSDGFSWASRNASPGSSAAQVPAAGSSWSHGAESHGPVAHGIDHGQDHQTHRDWDQTYLDGPWD